MANYSAADVKRLRELTGAGMLDCKNALVQAAGDFDAAVEALRLKGAKDVTKRAGRTAANGLVTAELDGTSAGVLVELNCETDFVARTEDFKTLARELAMHIAAARPLAVRVEDLPPETLARERQVYEAQVAEQKKPENIRAKIVDGMMKKFYEDNVLLEQKFVRDDQRTVGELVKELSAKTGEKIEVRRFSRLKVGES